jgi:type I restriction enzyme, S subunit
MARSRTAGDGRISGFVQLLDLLSELATELTTQLDAELEARQRQYAYYRDDLFSFRGVDDAERVPMGQVGQFIRGRRFTKDDVVDKGIPSIHYGEIYTTYGIAAAETVSRVRGDMAAQLRYAKPGDVVIAAVGETVKDVGKAVAWLGTTDVAIHDDCFLYRSEILDPKFVSYYLGTDVLNRDKAKYVARAKVKRLSGEGLAKLVIPVPPLDEQKQIVAILDKFDALVTDLSAALPTELSARRKQYEYCRDRLLTFKELSA